MIQFELISQSSQWQSKDIKTFKKISQSITKLLPKHGIVLLKGPMAAGKTTMIKEIVENLQGKYDNSVASPTFTLHRQYSNNIDYHIDHWDLFRIKDEDDLETVGFWDQFSNITGLIFIEWPERINLNWLPRGIALFMIDIVVENKKRNIRFMKRI